MTLIQAQTKFIERVNSCHPGHRNRVHRSAWVELHKWAEKRGYDSRQVCRDASEMAKLERMSDD